MKSILQIRERIDAVLPEIIAIRRDLHQYPELSGQEVRTAAKVSAYLSAQGISHETGVAGHGVLGIIGKASPKAVAIRADMDALPLLEANDVPYQSKNPGVMHACGHDIHTAVLLGTATILKEMEKDLPGAVKLIFQPTEETTGGALPMIKAGCLLNPKVNWMIGLHVEPDIPVGAVEFKRGVMNAASCEFTLTVTGSSSHGAKPHLGVDAILVASQIVSALQSIISRNLAATDAAVVSIGIFQGGTAPNILAKTAQLKGILRTLRPETKTRIVCRLKDIAKATALAYGATAKVQVKESYPALINDEEAEKALEEAATACFSPSNIYFREAATMGTDDFSYFCNATKGVYFNLGTNSHPKKAAAPLHSEYYLPDEACIKAGILMETVGVLKLLNRPSL